MLDNQEVNVLLIEDHPLFSMIIKDIVSEHFATACVKQARQLKDVAQYKGQHFDLVITDLNLPDSQGGATFERIKNEVHYSSLLVISSENSALLDLPDSTNFLSKTVGYAETVSSICQAIESAGKRATHQVDRSALVNRNEHQSTVLAPGQRKPLTSTQASIMELVIAGHSTKEIAKIQGRSPETIKAHFREILIRLGARSRADAVATFIKSQRLSNRLLDAT
jgi:two-component system nitrate/nitrite response regulator NarL